MSMLPQVERALVDAAARHHGRRRRIRRVAVTATVATFVASIGLALATLPGGVEREVSVGRPSPSPASDPAALAAAAGCSLRHPRPGGSQHEARTFRRNDYGSNPPVGGDHHPEATSDGIHGTPELGRSVHSLEHGRIHLQYRPGSPQRIVDDLVELFEETDGHHLLLYENTTGMRSRVAVTAWGHSLTCDDTTPAALEAMRAFRDAYVDKGPELVP